MKKMSRDEMKNVMGGRPPKTKWYCFVYDGVPGGSYYYVCAFDDPTALCQYLYCDPVSLCTNNTFCTL